ncbi:MAG: DUF3253 domain-containing protein [Leptolyngbyaceae cyanobacterium MO_188.B28]|nr:DUF3253 domain-containing protein [Leptolyngbyaceae cyanobacterium MO_188.B28]
MNQQTIRECILAKVQQRGLEKTICPSEVARDVGGAGWRELMPVVREVGTLLAAEGQIVVTQRGQVVDPLSAKGAIRYRLAK